MPAQAADWDFWAAGRALTRLEAHSRAQRLRDCLKLSGDGPVIASVPTGPHLVVLLLATRGLNRAVGLTGVDAWTSASETFEAEHIVSPTGDADFTVQGIAGAGSHRVSGKSPGLWLFSSGTTGPPKPVGWAWDDLTKSKPWPTTRGGERWGIGYAPHSFAGVTALCQALGRGAVVEFLRPSELVPGARQPPLDVLAATPSFWRLAAIAAGASGNPRRIVTATMGGEAVDQSLLRLVRATIAPQRIKQIFGATEFGTLLVVDDGLPGLPAELLGTRLANGMAFSVHDDRLMVSQRPGQPFLPTGDVVYRDTDRIHVIGRLGLHINVGGRKANPYRITDVLQQHPNVMAARAYGIRSAILGQVVAADVVAHSDLDPDHLIGELKQYTTARLEPHECPRRILLVDDIPLAASGKLAVQR